MNQSDIAKSRLINQQIAESKFKTATEIVNWMGAMQAQDYNMVKWAVGLRLPDSTDKTIETAINKGEILRTHLLRPTWHLVSANDINWMLDLTAPQIKTSIKTRHTELGLTSQIINKCYNIIEKALTGGNHLTREELISELKANKIETDNSIASHIMLEAEINKIVCSGAIKNKKQTYALFTERVPKSKTLNRDEALAELAKRYLTSHCPATLQDFVWWSGLPVADARHAIEMVKSLFISEKIDSQTYLFTNSFSISKTNNDYISVLPAFDEYIISYRDRSSSLPQEHNRKAVSDNGIFRPIIAINGSITGIWKRFIKKEKTTIDIFSFNTQTKATKHLIDEAFERYGQFLNSKIEITHH